LFSLSKTFKMDFDQKAKDWDIDPQRVERAKRFAGEIISLLGNKKYEHALEFGSGTGLVSFQLINHFKKITLADTSQGMVDVLKEKIRKENISNMVPLLTDIFKENIIGHDFDSIYTLLTLHHIKNIGKTFEIFNSILKQGGTVFIGDLVTEDGSFHFRDPEFDGHKGFDTEEMKKLMIRKGFEITGEKIFTVIEREVNNEVKKYPLFLLAGRKK